MLNDYYISSNVHGCQKRLLTAMLKVTNLYTYDACLNNHVHIVVVVRLFVCVILALLRS